VVHAARPTSAAAPRQNRRRSVAIRAPLPVSPARRALGGKPGFGPRGMWRQVVETVGAALSNGAAQRGQPRPDGATRCSSRCCLVCSAPCTRARDRAIDLHQPSELRVRRRAPSRPSSGSGSQPRSLGSRPYTRWCHPARCASRRPVARNPQTAHAGTQITCLHETGRCRCRCAGSFKKKLLRAAVPDASIDLLQTGPPPVPGYGRSCAVSVRSRNAFPGIHQPHAPNGTVTDPARPQADGEPMGLAAA
jgi:hypothetical protein